MDCIEKEEFEVNYRSLPSSVKELDNDEDVRKAVDKMNKEIAELNDTLGKLNAPNLKAKLRLVS